VSYIDAIMGTKPIGQKVAVIGAGGIGFDTATLLTAPVTSLSLGSYLDEWGVDPTYHVRGGVKAPTHLPTPRQVWLLQRSKGKIGSRLGKTTGWAHRLTLKFRGVQMIAEVEYHKIDDAGLHISIKGVPQVLDVDTVVICAGQESLRDLYQPLLQSGIPVHLIGGAKEAGELDAKRAIEDGLKLEL
jgi:2,4-dienoyl-CoA reductase (NADPH2)